MREPELFMQPLGHALRKIKKLLMRSRWTLGQKTLEMFTFEVATVYGLSSSSVA